MKLFLQIMVTALAGAALGLAATHFMVSRGLSFDRVMAGPWRAMPQVPATGGDPYARAAIARSGQAPLGVAEGLAFTAVIDSDGATLDAACDYRVSGAVPPTRFWTLTVTDADGKLVASAARQVRRAGFTSSEILRDGVGGFQIVLAREARAGNWLPLAQPGSFMLALRLYDSPHSLQAGVLDAAEMPTIVVERCP
jgi:hypothetical protein